MFTGERIQAGKYKDGKYVFPLDFLHYYKNYDIGIPLEYEEYLKTILSLAFNLQIGYKIINNGLLTSFSNLLVTCCTSTNIFVGAIFIPERW